MAEHNDLGKWGENYAAEYLMKQGYIIMDRNWRYGRSLNDLDIICKTEDLTTVVFVEVKTRSHEELVRPEAAIDRKKIYHIGRAADHYVKLFHINERLRFDIITIIGTKESGDVKLNHIVDAFSPLRI
jgi:putative endonuclease